MGRGISLLTGDQHKGTKEHEDHEGGLEIEPTLLCAWCRMNSWQTPGKNIGPTAFPLVLLVTFVSLW